MAADQDNKRASGDKAVSSALSREGTPSKRARSEESAHGRRSTPQSPAKRPSRRNSPKKTSPNASSLLTNTRTRGGAVDDFEAPQFSTPEPPTRRLVPLIKGEDLEIVSAADCIKDVPGEWSFNEPFHVSVQLPNKLESYPIWHPKSSGDYTPLAELRTVMATAATMFTDKELQSKINDPLGGDSIVRRFAKAIKKDDKELLTKTINEFNTLVTGHRSELRRFDPLKPEMAHEILTMAYCRTVSPRASQLRDYKSFSNNVYGELLPGFCTKIFNETGLTKDGVFVDLGSGVGNVTLQAALEVGCESWGCEIMPLASELAALQKTEVEARAAAWGLPTGKITLLSEDFVNNAQIQGALRRASVVLVNNYAFDGELNNQLLQMFLDLPEGTKIVSLKSFVPPGHTISAHNIESPMNILKVYHREFGHDSVNWSPAAGDYYIAVVDRSRLAAYI